jgi:hypothetical protein
MAETIDLPAAQHVGERHRDRWIALSVFVFCWLLFAAVEQIPLLFAALLYSAVFAAAAAAYGLQGVMEPGVWTLRQRLIANHYQFYQGLFWVALIAGVLGEVLYHVFCVTKYPISLTAAPQSRRGMPQRSKVISAVASRRRRRKN